MMTSARFGLLLVPCLCLALFACDDDESVDPLVRDAEPFANGVAKDTEGGAFRVVLSSRDGDLGVGENLLVVHVGFHDPNDPLAPGVGIPKATIELSAWMPIDDGAIEQALSARHVGEGDYLVDTMDLDQAGVWQFDLAIAVGATMRENVSFAFEVSE